MSTIPIAFLSHASRILTESGNGLSGSRIVEFRNAFAVDHGVDTPHATYPFDAPNKRTALLENLRAFPAEVQYEMLLDLCDLAGRDRPEVQAIRAKLTERFKGLFGGQSAAVQSADASPVLGFLGVSGAADSSELATTPPLQRLVVFLCHASEDKASARDLYKQLLSDGYDPWLDEEKLLPGQEWQVEIDRALRRADVVLVCLSRRSIDKTGYVQREIRTALDAAEYRPEKSIYIIPARIEDCEVPERLSKWHWVDIFSDGGYKRLCLTLDSQLKDRLEKTQSSEEGKAKALEGIKSQLSSEQEQPVLEAVLEIGSKDSSTSLKAAKELLRIRDARTIPRLVQIMSEEILPTPTKLTVMRAIHAFGGDAVPFLVDKVREHARLVTEQLAYLPDDPQFEAWRAAVLESDAGRILIRIGAASIPLLRELRNEEGLLAEAAKALLTAIEEPQ